MSEYHKWINTGPVELVSVNGRPVTRYSVEMRCELCDVVQVFTADEINQRLAGARWPGPPDLKGLET